MVKENAYSYKKTARKGQRKTWLSQLVIRLILILCSVICLYPLLNVLAKSFSSAAAISDHPLMILARDVTFEAYRYILKTPVLWKSFGITVFSTVVGTAMNLMITTTCAYALSRTKAPGNKIMLWIVVFPMLFGGGLIPVYILLSNLHLLDSIWVLIIPSLLSPVNALLMRNFMWSIPDSLYESAMIDGAGEMTILCRIILPLSKPIIATVGLFYAVGHWNDYFTGLYYINDNTKWPLQVLLRSIIVDFNTAGMGTLNTSYVGTGGSVIQPENIKAACIIFATVPIVLVYPFLQKYFVKGVIVGAVKG